jgi:diguanylate cyclase (GGDEF)-like protein
LYGRQPAGAEETILEINKWRYFGFSKEEYVQCRKYIFVHNLRSVCISSFVAALMAIILSFYPGNGQNKGVVFYLPALLFIIVFFAALFLRNRNELTKILVGFVIGSFVIAITSFSIMVLLYSESAYAIRFLLYFFIFEALIVLGPLFSIVTNGCIVLAAYIACQFVPPSTFNNVFPNWIFNFYNVAITAVFSTALNWFTSYVNVKNWILTLSLTTERNKYREESVRDTLTGLNNRRSFDQSVDFYISVCSHVHQTVCVVMMDVDYFKLYNDFYGHPKGDIVLQSLGNVLKKLVDEEHVYSARVGGEEFIVLWTENRTIECERIALKLRQLIIDLKMPHEKSKAAPYITASFGMYIMRGGTQSNAEELYRMADTALYKAKEWGRNRIVLYDSQDGNFREVSLRNYREIRRN